jgi:hypothetical protein
MLMWTWYVRFLNCLHLLYLQVGNLFPTHAHVITLKLAMEEELKPQKLANDDCIFFVLFLFQTN